MFFPIVKGKPRQKGTIADHPASGVVRPVNRHLVKKIDTGRAGKRP